MNNECYQLLSELRRHDAFPHGLNQAKMIDLFFPTSTLDLALDLSNVTSAFYGIMLETCSYILKPINVDRISKSFFYRLGRVKARVTYDKMVNKFDIPKDARGVVIILISAIYNASPEYRFSIPQYKENFCEILLSGVDRYYRITKSLNIEKNLQWPVLHTFMEGIKDELSINVTVESEMLNMNDTGDCLSRYYIKGI